MYMSKQFFYEEKIALIGSIKMEIIVFEIVVNLNDFYTKLFIINAGIQFYLMN